MSNDIAIEYNAKVIEVKDNIKQLETLEMQTDNYRTTVEKIETEVKLEVKKCYENYNKADSNVFLHDLLIKIYSDAIKRLAKINDYIVSEYEDYYKIQVKCNELNKKLKNVDNFNIQEIVKEVSEILKEIRKSTLLDYEQEKNIVENIYKLVYRIIKLEIIYTNNSSILEYIRSDDSDVSYITQLIKEDIRKIEVDEENEELINKVQEIEKNGLKDRYFLDRDLILLISLIRSDDLTEEVKKRFLNQIDNYSDISTELSEMQSNNESTSNRIIEIKKDNKKILIKRLIKKIILILNMGLVSSAIIGSIAGARNITKRKEYKTITTTYDTSIPETDPIIEYLPDTPNSVTIVEYSPWDEPGYFRNEYRRTIYTYDLVNLDVFYDDVKDYLNSELKDNITATAKIEVRTEAPEDNYSKNKYVINQVVQDKSDYREIDSPTEWKILSGIFSFGIVAIDTFLLAMLSKTSKKLKLQKQENKLELTERKQALLENNTRINELSNNLICLKGDIEKEYDILPNAIKQDKKIKEKILLLEKNNM